MPLLALSPELSQPRQLRITESENKAAEHNRGLKHLSCSAPPLCVCVSPAELRGTTRYHAQGATLLPSSTLQIPVTDELWGARPGYRGVTEVDYRPWVKGSSSMAIGDFLKFPLWFFLKGCVQSTCFCQHWPGVYGASSLNLVFQIELEQYWYSLS